MLVKLIYFNIIPLCFSQSELFTNIYIFTKMKFIPFMSATSIKPQHDVKYLRAFDWLIISNYNIILKHFKHLIRVVTSIKPYYKHNVFFFLEFD